MRALRRSEEMRLTKRKVQLAAPWGPLVEDLLVGLAFLDAPLETPPTAYACRRQRQVVAREDLLSKYEDEGMVITVGLLLPVLLLSLLLQLRSEAESQTPQPLTAGRGCCERQGRAPKGPLYPTLTTEEHAAVSYLLLQQIVAVALCLSCRKQSSLQRQERSELPDAPRSPHVTLQGGPRLEMLLLPVMLPFLLLMPVRLLLLQQLLLSRLLQQQFLQQVLLLPLLLLVLSVVLLLFLFPMEKQQH